MAASLRHWEPKAVESEDQSTATRDRLTRLLCGTFSNRQQAFENPPLYGHIMVRFRPLPQLDVGSLLLEQAYAIAPNEPYRVRVLRPAVCPQRGLTILNFAIHDDRRFWGAIDDAPRRSEIQEHDLQLLDGCTYIVEASSAGFLGKVEPGCRCLVTRKGHTSYLVSEFELNKTGMQTIDRGYHPETHEHLWGSIAGPFQFEREIDWGDESLTAWAN